MTEFLIPRKIILPKIEKTKYAAYDKSCSTSTSTSSAFILRFSVGFFGLDTDNESTHARNKISYTET
jgi:hypothetical protein